MISANQYNIKEVLGDSFIHEVPPYQRPYAWTADEAVQLLRDLLEASLSPAEPYFLGSIVLIKAKEEALGYVVDGQQRLTTVTILSAVLRDVADDDLERKALADTVYIEPNPFLAQVEAVRVRAHVEDRVFFREAIQMPGATAFVEPPQRPRSEAQRLMWNNAVELRKVALQLKLDERRSLVAFLLNKCVMVVVATESRAAALRIFRVLNDRGVDLTNADIIKAELLEKFTDQDELMHQAAKWREMENDLGRDDFESLLENIRFIRDKTRSRTTLSDAYHVRFGQASVTSVRNFLDHDLPPAKIWYSRIVDEDGSSFQGESRSIATEALAGLRLLQNKDWISVALAVALRHGLSVQTAEAFQKLEGLAWIMQLSRRYDTQRLNRYSQIIKALDEPAASLDQELRPSQLEMLHAWRALNGPLYDEFPTRVVRALLERLDRLLAEQPISWNGQITVEHILPQSPAQGSWAAFDDAYASYVTHRLGNLVLLTKKKNSSASNYEFTRKRDVYFGLSNASGKRATYASAQELAHLSKWEPDDFSARHLRHVTKLADRWGIDPDIEKISSAASSN